MNACKLTWANEGVDGELPTSFSGVTEGLAEAEDDDSPTDLPIDRVADSSRDGEVARDRKSWNFSGVKSEAEDPW